jgi:subtilisin family serine protease
VHVAHPHVQAIAGGIGIDDRGVRHPDYLDRLGHGTAVVAAIREKAPSAAIYVIRVFDRQLGATGIALVKALECAREWGAEIVNLSLGTTNTEHEPALATAVNELRAAGAVVVAAAPQRQQRWLPGALAGVIGVTLDMTVPRDTCVATSTPDGGLLIAASGYPRPIPGVPPARNLQGLSFAVANATGLVAKAWPDWQSALLHPSDRSL